MLNEGFRYRDLETDRFITRDPAGFVDGPNLYTYVVQNPWTAFDPEGLAAARTYSPQRRLALGAQNARFRAQSGALYSMLNKNSSVTVGFAVGVGIEGKAGPVKAKAKAAITVVEGKRRGDGSDIIRQGGNIGGSLQVSKIKLGLEAGGTGGVATDVDGKTSVVNTNDSVLGYKVTPGKGTSIDNDTISASITAGVVKYGIGFDLEGLSDDLGTVGDVAEAEFRRNFSKNEVESNQTQKDSVDSNSSKKTRENTDRQLNTESKTKQKPKPPAKKDKEDK